MTKGKSGQVEEILVSGRNNADDDGLTPKQQQQQFHLINCKLAESKCDQPIDQFFTSQMKLFTTSKEKKTMTTPSSEVMKVSFRGRPLNGKKVQLPESSYVFAQVSKSPENSGQLIASGLSRELTYWNLDKLPSSSDPVPQMVKWLQLSDAIHAQVQLTDAD